MQIFEVLLVTFILLLCVNSQQGVQSTIEPFISIAFVHKKEYNIMWYDIPNKLLEEFNSLVLGFLRLGLITPIVQI